MDPIGDSELLARYAQSGSQAAFAELVRRHLNLVYSAALRQVHGDVGMAQDVAQTVFTDLARKAATLRVHKLLPGWLYTSTRYAALQAMRTAHRRQAREQKALQMDTFAPASPSPADWNRVEPVIDEAMLELGEKAREAVLLRFFDGQSFPEVGANLGISEDAARKRVDRALHDLRAALARRGITSTAAALGLLMDRAVIAAPTGFDATVTAAAVSSAAGTVGAVSLWQIFCSAKAVVGLGAVILAGSALILGVQYRATADLRSDLEHWRGANERLANLLASPERNAEIARLEANLAFARRSLATASAAASAPRPPAGGTDPEAQRRTRLLRRTALDTSYAALFRSLSLPPTQLTALIELLVDKSLAISEAHRLARSQGVIVRTQADAVFLNATATAEVSKRIGELLGPTKFAYYQNYEHTLPFRYPIAQVAQQLAQTSTTLTDEQVDRMVDLVAAAYPTFETAFDGLPYVIPSAAIANMTTALAPSQLAAVKELQAAQLAQREMLRLNRDAATKGQLRLTSQSLKEYPPPADSPAGNAPAVTRYGDVKVPSARSLVSVSLRQEHVSDALVLYSRLTGKKLDMTAALAAPDAPRISMEFKDLPPTAAVMLLSQALMKAGIVLTRMDEDTERAGMVELPPKS